jgi:hypothetical protein
MLETIRLDCRVEKKSTEHKIVKVTDNLPPFVHCVECLSCGTLGISTFQLDDEEAK